MRRSIAGGLTALALAAGPGAAQRSGTTGAGAVVGTDPPPTSAATGSAERADSLLTLTAALARGNEAAYANRVAAGRTEEQSSKQIAALQGILPTVRIEAGATRTTDPIGAFGVALRQRRITQADFDPARLNDPAPAVNHTAAVVLQQPLLNTDAHLGRMAAGHAAAAGAAAERWTRLGTRLDVVRAYYGAVMATEQVSTLEAAAAAAAAHVKQARALVANGIATKSDALLAEVKAGEVDAQLVGARGDVGLARRRLALAMGTPDDTAFALPAALPSSGAIRALVAADEGGAASESSGGASVPAGRADAPAAPLSSSDLAGVARRSDMVAAREGLAAARLDVRRAQSLLLPRVNAFARYDWNAERWAWGPNRNWTVGIMASWTPFAGGSQVAQMRAAAGRRAAARAGAEAAEAKARLEAAQAENARTVALARLEIAERGAAQAAEAHRIVTKKYEGGLATVLELLDAAAQETHARLTLSTARYQAIVAEAERLRDTGRDPAALGRLDTLDGRTNR